MSSPPALSLPYNIVTDIPGYHNLSLLYAVGYLQVFRGIRSVDGVEIYLKLCPTAHLETLARLNHNWTLQREIAINGVTFPSKFEPYGEGGKFIEYRRYGERTSREMWLSPEPYVSNGSGIDSTAINANPEPMHRTHADILAILKAFITVCSVLGFAYGRYVMP